MLPIDVHQPRTGILDFITDEAVRVITDQVPSDYVPNFAAMIAGLFIYTENEVLTAIDDLFDFLQEEKEKESLRGSVAEGNEKSYNEVCTRFLAGLKSLYVENLRSIEGQKAEKHEVETLSEKELKSILSDYIETNIMENIERNVNSGVKNPKVVWDFREALDYLANFTSSVIYSSFDLLYEKYREIFYNAKDAATIDMYDMAMKGLFELRNRYTRGHFELKDLGEDMKKADGIEIYGNFEKEVFGKSFFKEKSPSDQNFNMLEDVENISKSLSYDEGQKDEDDEETAANLIVDCITRNLLDCIESEELEFHWNFEEDLTKLATSFKEKDVLSAFDIVSNVFSTGLSKRLEKGDERGEQCYYLGLKGIALLKHQYKMLKELY